MSAMTKEGANPDLQEIRCALQSASNAIHSHEKAVVLCAQNIAPT